MLLSRHQGLLGTVIDLRLEGESDSVLRACESSVVAEIIRLQGILNSYDESSELCRWQRGETAPGSELTQVLTLAATWHERTDGAFNVSAAFLTGLWEEAAKSDELPTSETLQDAVRRCVDIPYGIDRSGFAMREGRCSVDVNGIAKGWIMDRAVDTAFAHPGVLDVMINAGGDLRHKGPLGMMVGIEDPARPFDNLPPMTVVQLRDGALATSGGGRRGWRIRGRWYGHVIDPRSGWPADAVASASVIAREAATADAVATTLAVLGAEKGLAFADAIDGIGCLVVDRDGTAVSNDVWAAATIR